jgi:exodeoxyribonuclease V alpha subunit
MSNLQHLLAKHKEAMKNKESAPPAPTVFNIPSLHSIPSEHPAPNKEPTGPNNVPDNPKESGRPEAEFELDDPDEIHNHPGETDFSHRQITDKYGNTITLNEQQWAFVELVLSGKSAVLIGPAGTGKTTTMKAVFTALLNANKIPIISNHGHKYLPENAPGISISAFTRRATNNIRRNVSEDLQANCITIHKLLEYEPQFYEEYDAEKGKEVTKMIFAPARNQLNPLPGNLRAIAFEESSMISTQLHSEVVAATPGNDVQYIYLGDIQQLPPVFGQAILGFKMLELPVVELTEVYRQAFDSPIIKLAHRILSGRGIPGSEYKDWHFPGKLTLFPWKKRIAADVALLTIAKFFVGDTKDDGTIIQGQLQKGLYNPETDAILLPFNKSCGTDELNKHIASRIAKSTEKIVWEVIHGFRKSYYSVGDKVLYDREDGIIKNIYRNPAYSGVAARSESVSMDYWGNKPKSKDAVPESGDLDQDEDDFILSQVSMQSTQDDERVRACSHVIEVELLDSGRTVQINQAGQVNNLILGYAITVHKSQGSEWDKVYLCLHQSHATMLQRELLYTAVTRAKKELFVICEDDTFMKGVQSQRIKGNTLAEKAEYFKGKVENGDLQS